MATTIRPILHLLLLSTLFFLLCFPTSSSAASGGRMGGTSRSSRSSSSRSSSSRSSSSHHYYHHSSLPYHYSSSHYNGDGGSSYGGLVFFLIFMGSIFGLSYFFGNRTSVIKLQVCLSGEKGRLLQKNLDEIAQAADTSTDEGLNFILKESILALLRHPEYIISAHSSVDEKLSLSAGEKHFNQLSIEEREKFDDETLVNVNDIKRKKDSKLAPENESDIHYVVVEPENKSNIQYIVLTILVVVSRGQKLAPISTITDLKEVLRNLGSFLSREIKAVEVLWTPQQENESISEEKLHKDYPFLRPLYDNTAEPDLKKDSDVKID